MSVPRRAVEAASRASYERGNSEPWGDAAPSIKDEFYADAIVMLTAAAGVGFGQLPDDSTLSRVEIIDGSGRAFIKYTPAGTVTLARQDDGRTLKVFISEENSSAANTERKN